MSRLMSVSLTEQAVIERRKTVTRRLGWLFLKPGDTLTLCLKVMGRKKGEPLHRICDVRVLTVRREPLFAITQEEVEREGFRGWKPARFIAFFAGKMGCTFNVDVTRIEWEYLNGGEETP
jgi:hypothetical protein